jgi:peptidyl-prolyl cis-trans isomerase-like protein 2
MKDDPLKGINVDAAGGAGKVLKMIAERVRPTLVSNHTGGSPADNLSSH